MKRVLSLLLLIPLLTTQTWARRGGPYDSIFGRSQTVLSGMYGVVFQGSGDIPLSNGSVKAGSNIMKVASTSGLAEGMGVDDAALPANTFIKSVIDGTTVALSTTATADAAGLAPVVHNGNYDPNVGYGSSTGVMSMAIPTSGMATGAIMVFNGGMMYAGRSSGTVDIRSGKVVMLSQLSHFAVHTFSDGSTKGSSVVVDSILSGRINLQLELDYFSGLITAEGQANYSLYNPLLASVTASTVTDTTTLTGQGTGTNGEKLQNVNSTTTVTSSTTDPNTGEVTTTSVTTTSGVTNTNTTTKTTTMYDKDAVTQKPDIANFLSMAASGVREDTLVAALPSFALPTEAGGFQMNLGLPTGGTAVGGAAGAATGTTGN